MTATECQRRGGRGRGDSCSSRCKHCILRVFERRRDGSKIISLLKADVFVRRLWIVRDEM